MVAKRATDAMGPAGLTKGEDLRTALERLREVNRPAYLGGVERWNITEAIKAIEGRLNPKPVDELLSVADRVCSPLEKLLTNIDRQAVVECLG